MASISSTFTNNSVTLWVKDLDKSYAYKRKFYFYMGTTKDTTLPNSGGYTSKQSCISAAYATESPTVTFSNLTPGTMYYFRAYIWNIAEDELLAKTPKTGDYGYAVKPGYNAVIKSVAAASWSRNVSYPAQGVAKITFTTKNAPVGKTPFSVKVGDYVKTIYTNEACTQGGVTTFGDLYNVTRYFKLDNLYDNKTTTSYTIKMYGDNSALSGTTLNHQAAQYHLAASSVGQTTALVEYGVSIYTANNWRLAIYKSTDRTPTYTKLLTVGIGSYTFTGLKPSTSYTIKLEYKKSASTWSSVAYDEITTKAAYTAQINYFDTSTSTSKSIYTFYKVHGETITLDEIKAHMPTGYTYVSCAVKLPYVVTANCGFKVYIKLPAYTITYNSNGSGQAAKTQEKPKGQSVTLYGSEAFSWAGHTLVNWRTGASSGTTYALKSTYSTDADLLLYAQWSLEPKKFALKFDPNGDGAYDVPAVQYSPSTQAQSYPMPIPSTPVPKREKYKFKYYTLDKEGTGTAYYPGGTITVTQAETTLYAIWDAGYDVHIFASPEGAGTIDGERVSATEKAFNKTLWTVSNDTLSFSNVSGEVVSFYPVPNAGYEKQTPTVWDVTSSSGTISGETNFKAVFNTKDIKVKLNTDGGKAKKGKESLLKDRVVHYKEKYSTDYSSGSPITVELPDNSSMEKKHCTFNHWETETEEPELVTNDTPVSIPDNHSIKAIWEPTVYKVKFVTDVGKYDTLTFAYPDLSTEIPTTYRPFKEDYIFNGWNTKQDGTGNSYWPKDDTSEASAYTITYDNESEAFDKDSHTLTLYVQWMPDMPIKIALDNKFKPVDIKQQGVSVCLGDGQWATVDEWWIHDGTTWKYMVVNQ